MTGLKWQGTVTGRISSKTSNPNRFDDLEVLFTTLILVLGEPPTPPIDKEFIGSSMKYAYDMKEYARDVKCWMGEFGHNAHQGLFTKYMHWCKENWDAKR